MDALGDNEMVIFCLKMLYGTYEWWFAACGCSIGQRNSGLLPVDALLDKETVVYMLLGGDPEDKKTVIYCLWLM